jgi:hypothetical protein
MLIDTRRILEHRFSETFPELTLTAVEEIAIPVSKVDIEVLGELTSQIPPATEYILRFVELGINSADSLASALGISMALCLELVADEVRAGNLAFTNFNTDVVTISHAGTNVLRTCLSKSPKVTTRSYLFDTTDSWGIASSTVQSFLTQKDLRNLNFDFAKLLKAKNETIQKDSIDPVILNRRSSGALKGERFEIQQVRRVIRRRHGYVLGQLLIYFDGKTKNDFILLIDGARSIAHEAWLRKSGGLSSIGVDLEILPSEEALDATSQIAALPPIESIELDPDGGVVAPYDHPEYLNDALDNSKHRFLVFSPWVGGAIVNDNFRYRLEKLLQRNVKVCIGWGFGTDRESEKSKNSREALNRLLRLAKKYDNFRFVKFDDSHAKVLLYDDIYISTSFNWLSFRGDKRRPYRTEIGEKRTDSRVVNDRYERMLEEASNHGRRMTEDLIP